MQIITKIHELEQSLAEIRALGKTIGFVPTMGALHEGHISIINTAIASSDFVVCSIFVNPTQFNNKRDLETYPRTPEADAQMLRKAGCNVLFMPSVEDIYPESDKRIFEFGKLDSILEGAYRPGHFNGVGQVVSRLFEIVQPNKAYFGKKDYQQLLIIKKLCELLKIKVEIIPCDTQRESDGLAMSSRNMRLNLEERKAASKIPLLMNKAKNMLLEDVPLEQVKSFVTFELSKDPIYKLEYFELCSQDNLEIQNSLNQHLKSIILIACYVGSIRLIDNLVIN